jgi:hypothetical protein
MTVERTRQACIDGGLEAALSRHPRSRPGNQKFDGATEAHWIALACGRPSAGRKRWTLHLLAAAMMEGRHFETIAPETIRQH